jgi:hypothetical protein
LIRGTLSEFSLAEIIRLIAQTRRTGVLEISGPGGSGRVLFRNGAICGAESSRSREPLGRKLVRSGVLSESQLWNSLSRQDRTHLKIGETLISSGLATTEHVDSALREQVEDSIVDVLRLELTEFTWRSETPDEPVVVSAEKLLGTLSERLNELETIRKHIPSDRSTVVLAPMPPGADEIRLTPEEWRVLVFLGSRRMVLDLLRYSGSGETQTLRSLDRLVSKGLIEVDAPAAQRRSPSAESRGWSASARVPPPPPPGPVSTRENVIRLSNDGNTKVIEGETFKMAFLGREPLGLCRQASDVFAGFAQKFPANVAAFSLGGRHSVSQAGPADAVGSVRRLKPGALAHMDLVICFEWGQVESAVVTGGAPPERTFTLLELWALVDTLGAHTPGIQRARQVVERANSRRIRHAELLSNLEMSETGGPGEEQEKLTEVCASLAEALFG